jgi:hypothetical protein
MIKREASSHVAVLPLTARAVRVEIRSTSRSDLSDKNGQAIGRKNRRKAVFAFVGL